MGQYGGQLGKEKKVLYAFILGWQPLFLPSCFSPLVLKPKRSEFPAFNEQE